MADGPAASVALLPAVGGLVRLLRDDGFDVAFAQVGAVAAGRVGLVSGNRVRSGARAADGAADPDLPSTGMNCGLSAAWPAVRTKASGQHLRSAAEMYLAGLPAP